MVSCPCTLSQTPTALVTVESSPLKEAQNSFGEAQLFASADNRSWLVALFVR